MTTRALTNRAATQNMTQEIVAFPEYGIFTVACSRQLIVWILRNFRPKMFISRCLFRCIGMTNPCNFRVILRALLENRKKLFVRVAHTWHFRYANICFDFAYESRIWQLNIFVFICFPCKCNNETRSLSHFWFHSPVKCRNWKWQLDGRRNFW